MVKLEVPTTGVGTGVFGSEEAIARAIVELVNVEKVYQLTELDEDEIKSIALLYFIARMIDSKKLLDFIKTYMMLKVSKDRKGRKEITLIASQAGFMEIGKGRISKSLLPGFG